MIQVCKPNHMQGDQVFLLLVGSIWLWRDSSNAEPGNESEVGWCETKQNTHSYPVLGQKTKQWLITTAVTVTEDSKYCVNLGGSRVPFT